MDLSQEEYLKWKAKNGYGAVDATPTPDTPDTPDTAWTPNDEDLRADGSRKGNGFLGALQRPDGGVSSELSIGVDIDGKETEIPTLVPSLSKDEVDYLLATPPDKIQSADPKRFSAIQNKATTFARYRIGLGKNPFAELDESPTPTPAPTPTPTPTPLPSSSAAPPSQDEKDFAKWKADNFIPASGPVPEPDNTALRLITQPATGVAHGTASTLLGQPVDAAKALMYGENPLSSAISSALNSDTAQSLYDRLFGQDNPVTAWAKGNRDLKPPSGEAMDPVFGTKWLEEHVPNQRPLTKAERILDQTGRMAGVGLGMSLAPVGMGGDAAKLVSLPREMVTAAGAGLGGGLADEVSGPDNPSIPLNIVGQLAGGLGTELAGRGGAKLLDMATGGAARKAAAIENAKAGIGQDIKESAGGLGALEKNLTDAGVSPASDFPSSEGADLPAGEWQQNPDAPGGWEFVSHQPSIKLDQSMQDARDAAVAADKKPDIVPGLQLTLGQVTGAPNIISSERGKMSGHDLFQNEALDKLGTSRQAIGNFYDTIAKKPPEGAAAMSDAQDVLQNLMDEHAKNVADLAQAKVMIEPDMPATDAAQGLHSEVKDSMTGVKLAAGRVYDSVPGVASTSVSPLLNEVIDQVENAPALQVTMADGPPLQSKLVKNVPPIVKQLYDQLVAPIAQHLENNGIKGYLATQARQQLVDNARAPFGDLRSYRTQFLNELRAAEGAPDRNESLINNLRKLVGATEASIDTLENDSTQPDAAKILRGASKLYKWGMDQFRSHVIADLFSVDRHGIPKVQPGMTFDTLFKPGNLGKLNAEDLQRAGIMLKPGENVDPKNPNNWIPRPDIEPKVRQGVLNALAAGATTEPGHVDVALTNRFLQRFDGFLSKFPNLKAEVSNMGGLQDALDKKVIAAQQPLDQLRKSTAGMIIDMNPDAAVQKILSGRKTISEARALMKQVAPYPQATMGIRQSVLDYILKHSQSTQLGARDTYDFLHPGKLRAMIKRYNPVLREVLEPEQLRDLNRIQYSLDTVQRTLQPALGGTDTASKFINAVKLPATTEDTAKGTFKKLWNSLKTAGRATQLGAYVSGHPAIGIGLTTAQTLGEHLIDNELGDITEPEMKALWHQVFVDPKMAHMWAEHARGASPVATAKYFRTYLAGMGSQHEERRQAAAANPEDPFAAEPPLMELPEFKPPPKFEEQPPPPPKKVKPNPPPNVMHDLLSGRLRPTDLADVARMHQSDEIARRFVR